MNANTLIRWAGLSAMAAGILFILIQAIHPKDVLSSVGTDRWVIVHVMGVAMCLFGVFGLAGLYARQVNASGWLGFAGYLLFSLFWALALPFQFIEAVISPTLASQYPTFVNGFLEIAGGKTVQPDMGALPQVYAAIGGLYLLGGLVFGIATYRARVLTRWAGAALAFAAVLPLAGASVPHPYDRIFAVPMGMALAWLGYALWADRREPATAPVADRADTRLRRAGAR